MAKRQTDDMFGAAVKSWQTEPTTGSLREVLKHLRPIVSARSGDYPVVGREIAQAELTTAALRGLKRFNPSAGTQAKTWAVHSMRAANRPLLRRATPLRIPDARLQQVGKFQRAEEAEGTARQKAKSGGLSEKDYKLLQRELKSIRLTSKDELPRGQMASSQGETWKLLKHELSGHERSVYDMLDRGNTSTTEISKKLRISPSTVSYYKKQIRTKMGRFSGDGGRKRN
mgnify:CR=1 FL=1